MTITLGSSALSLNLADLIRDRYYAKVYRVNPAGTGGAFTTIAAVLTQIGTDNSFGSGYDRGPEWRRLVLVDPGTYTEAVNPPDFVDFIGTSGVASDVVVTQSGAVATLELGGKTALIANMSFVLGGTAPGGGIYAYHADAMGVPNVPQQRVIYNCAFTSTNPNRQQAMGLGIQPRSVEVQINCTYTPATGGSVLNLHNNSGAQSWRGVLVLINPTINGTTANAVGITDQGSGREDVFAIIGGSIAVSTPGNQVGIVNTAGTTMQYLLDPAVVSNYSVSNAASVINQRALVAGAMTGPIPAGIRELSEFVRSFYYPTKIRQVATLAPSVPDASAQTVTANRLYFVPLPLNAAWNALNVLQGIVSASGNIFTGLYLDDTTGKPGGYLFRSNTAAAAAGINTPVNGTGTRTIYPGYGQVWLGVVMDNATATLVCSSLLSTVMPIYYQDLGAGFGSLPTTATPVQLPAGAACPVPSLKVG